jgi:hypothetical protein
MSSTLLEMRRLTAPGVYRSDSFAEPGIYLVASAAHNGQSKRRQDIGLKKGFFRPTTRTLSKSGGSWRVTRLI